MGEWYKNIPSLIDPVAFSIDVFAVRWYAIMYLSGFATVYLITRRRLKKEKSSSISRDLVANFIIYSALGLLAGGRIGHILFYDWNYFSNNPLMIISPYDFQTGEYVGISGMSFFGGLIGTAIAGVIYLKRKKINILEFSELLIPAIPAGYFFGRIGNFINGELFGRPTNSILGMYFPTDSLNLLRHPTQLYEAFFEGIVLFLALSYFRKKSPFPGSFLALFFFGYGLTRFTLEFWREPEIGQLLFMNTLNISHFFSLIMIILAIGFYLYFGRKRCYNDVNKVK